MYLPIEHIIVILCTIYLPTQIGGDLYQMYLETKDTKLYHKHIASLVKWIRYTSQVLLIIAIAMWFGRN